MFSHYFAHYLLNTGILTPVQTREALQLERSARVKLGTLAVNAGLMTAAQVEEIHHLQRVKDKQFGVLAIEQGYLNSKQVDELLATQGSDHLRLVQAITDSGFLTLAATEKVLAKFRTEYDLQNKDSGSHNVPDTGAMVRKSLDFSALGDKEDLFYDYIGLTLRNIVRFLNDTPFILISSVADDQSSKWLVSQEIIGDVALFTGFEMDESVLLEIAGRFSGEKFTAVDELAIDSVGELLNVHNGVFCSNLSQADILVDLRPQKVQEDGRPIGAENYRITISTSFGRIDVILS